MLRLEIKKLKQELEKNQIETNKAFDNLDENMVYELFRKHDEIFNGLLRAQEGRS